MTQAEALALFEQPVGGDTAGLVCGHTAEIDVARARRKDGWFAAVRCPTCKRRREVVSVIYPTRRDQP